MKKDLKIIIGLSLALSVGLLLNILACALWKKWWPIFSVIAYILAPIPNMMCTRFGVGYDDSKARAFEDAGHFMTAIFVVSGLAIPALLAHIKVIEIGALLMCISGGVVVYGTILLYLHAFHGKKEDTSYEVY
jgi:hypothetical protein